MKYSSSIPFCSDPTYYRIVFCLKLFEECWKLNKKQGDSMKEETKENLKNTGTWMRFIYMVLFIIFYGIAEGLLMFIVLFQFIVTLITSTPNERVRPFSRQLSRYIYNVLLFLTYNSEEKPFPFSDWPTE